MDSLAKPWDLLNEYKKLKAPELIESLDLLQNFIEVVKPSKKATKARISVSFSLKPPKNNFDRLLKAITIHSKGVAEVLQCFKSVSLFGLHTLFQNPDASKLEVVTFLPTLSSIYLASKVSPNQS